MREVARSINQQSSEVLRRRLSKIQELLTQYKADPDGKIYSDFKTLRAEIESYLSTPNFGLPIRKYRGHFKQSEK